MAFYCWTQEIHITIMIYVWDNIPGKKASLLLCGDSRSDKATL